MKTYLSACLLAVLLSLTIAQAATDTNNSATRSRTTVYKFRSLHPCPANGSKHGACPGYVVDHIVALECGGEDAVENMQWQTEEAGRAKDKQERLCRKPKKG